MTRVIVAVDESRAAGLAEGLTRGGDEVVGVAAPGEAADALARFAPADVLVLTVGRDTLHERLVAACDRAGTRILPLCAGEAETRLAVAFGLAPVLPADAEGWMVADALQSAPEAPPLPAAAHGPRVVTVWGAAGAPGRSTIAVELAAELSRGRRRVCLVDADAQAPSLALLLGLADEGPGFPAACRSAERGGLDAAELARISTPVTIGDGSVDVLTGINRPSRWPELSERRVGAALAACRDWADHTVVDVASSLERDEEIVSDLVDGPRRNAATLAALRAADQIIAVVAADPLGIARFLRAHAELRATVGSTPITVVANRLRPGTLGIDAHGQVRRTLERFAGIRDVWFVPQDPRSVDAALLAARSVADIAPKAPLTLAVRRLAAEAVAPPVVRRPAQRARRGRRAMAAERAAAS
ncbi:AAA family ATPase [Microbacterium sp.]|uniref:AAA family ATPase n=1 Tax=Microbacterium sp. TaxID=51671 RepID=UPI003A92C6FF